MQAVAKQILDDLRRAREELFRELDKGIRDMERGDVISCDEAIRQIRMKPFSSYNIFFVVDTKTSQITILRVLKDRQNWKTILHSKNEYNF